MIPRSTLFWSVVAVVLIAATAAVLLMMGRIPIAADGTIQLWVGDPNAPGTSQHLSDWYTPSHIIHGFLFYGLGWLLLRRQPIGARLALAIVIEAAWEIAENSPAVIERYRATTIAVGYTGDSVLNSVADIVAMMVGFFLAARLPIWLTVVIALVMEVVVGLLIRDNLTLNVLMLLYPLDAVRAWQSGG